MHHPLSGHHIRIFSRLIAQQPLHPTVFLRCICKLPGDIGSREVIVLDPMLATGGSSIDAITLIKRHNPLSIKFMCIIAAPEGLKALTDAHPDVKVYCAALDEKLNDHCYIVPGLGDAGDRIFGTK